MLNDNQDMNFDPKDQRFKAQTVHKMNIQIKNYLIMLRLHDELQNRDKNDRNHNHKIQKGNNLT